MTKRISYNNKGEKTEYCLIFNRFDVEKKNTIQAQLSAFASLVVCSHTPLPNISISAQLNKPACGGNYECNTK